MKILLTGAESLLLEPSVGQLTIEAPSTDMSYSPFHMLGSSLATCTFSVLQSWATNKNLSVDDLRVDVSWSFADKPHRVGAIKVKLEWPSLAPDLRDRAIRVAHLCGVHNTFTHPPEIAVEVTPA
ncbi:MAG TPA: OsmC family protein [Gemmatimonadaceae bacterium]|nr:OsmC family protein [Gemmatimonadaceae bacterium]